MCTVTIVPCVGVRGAGVRVACNRDESRMRPRAHVPACAAFKDQRGIMPIDTAAGGTWIAASDAGLVMVLVNHNPGDMRGSRFPGKPSRGRIIPSLLDAASFGEAFGRIAAIDPDDYPPFRIVLTDGLRVVVFAPIGGRLIPAGHVLDRPVMFTSSGLGDSVVEPPRRALFDAWFGRDAGGWIACQDAFHCHSWPDRPEVSVCMSRPDARTVSLTVVELTVDRVSMRYYSDPPEMTAGHTLIELPCAGVLIP